MKKIFTLITAVLMTVSLTAYAQDARQRTVETIVQDALALMPVQHQNDFNREMEGLAKAAPQSIQYLAQMMQPAEKASNNLIEYALSGVVAYASTHPQYTQAVRDGLSVAAPRAIDATAREFLQAQLRLLGQEDVTYPKHTGAATYTALYDKLTALGANAGTEVLKAVRSKDRAYRMQALKFATDHQLADETLARKVAALFNAVPADAKVDILNWLGDNKVESQKLLIMRSVTQKGQIGAAAIEALGRIADESSLDILFNQLGNENDAAAAAALRSYKGNLSDKVTAYMQKTKGSQLISLISLASDRRIKQVCQPIINLCGSSDAVLAQAALNALPGVVTAAESAQLAGLLDKAAPAQVPAFQKALAASIRSQEPKVQYASLSGLMKQAAQKTRFYSVLAGTGTDESVAELESIWQGGQSEALKALMQSTNAKALKPLLKAAQSGNQEALAQCITLVNNHVQDLDERASYMTQGLELANTTAIKKTLLNGLGNTPTLPAYTVASRYLDDKELGYTAAYALKNIAGKCVDDIDYGFMKKTLTQASGIIAAGGSADDGYAVDEIKNLLAKEEPSPVFELPEDEKAAGYEVLFDGTNMDKWTGNKEGYTPVNGTIYVSANYGDEGNLYTVKEYQDFVFRFEFCFVRPGVNNGVGIRTPMNVDAAYYGMCESQILDHDDPIYAGLHEYQVHGSVYGVIPAKRIKHKPLGEWSTEEIRVQGDHITVTVNGEVIVDGNVREACQGNNVAPDGSDKNPYTVDHRNHPGMFNEKGHIGFCGHGAGIKFRNVRVLDLTAQQPVGKKAKKAKKNKK